MRREIRHAIVQKTIDSINADSGKNLFLSVARRVVSDSPLLGPSGHVTDGDLSQIRDDVSRQIVGALEALKATAQA